MPTYEYKCTTCNRTFDYFQPITAKALKTCPKEICAQKGKVERQLGAGGGILFKGSGFYSTDYRSSSYKSDKQKAETKTACDKPSCKNGSCGE